MEKESKPVKAAVLCPATRKIMFIIAVIACLTPVVSPPVALLGGIFLAHLNGNPYAAYTPRVTHLLLQISVVGLGFGMNAVAALKAGKEGFLWTVASIVVTLTAGWLAGKGLKIDRKTAYLISAGTAICGGSAIAAISPVIRAEQRQISVALGTVFMLNALALFLFPFIGQQLQLTQQQFGLWCAIAIHDTSSVVGAAAKYGPEALQIATTVKLARALWIIPLALCSSLAFGQRRTRIRIPYFIGLFVLAMLANSYLPFIRSLSAGLVAVAHAGLTLTLFLIGSSLSRDTLRAVGARPMIQGVLLWALISLLSLCAVLQV
ncbi:YeiH family protein [Taibaiella helva]|uniref:YeiH family protein n=1 Tax=Taibaiella helva TaxID=2301235 RepID=UPI000E579B50|nr:putative sulfate exporter family transporter [Taibaiella helva]